MTIKQTVEFKKLQEDMKMVLSELNDHFKKILEIERRVNELYRKLVVPKLGGNDGGAV